MIKGTIRSFIQFIVDGKDPFSLNIDLKTFVALSKSGNSEIVVTIPNARGVRQDRMIGNIGEIRQPTKLKDKTNPSPSWVKGWDEGWQNAA